MTILVTGGAGYIESHTVLELLIGGHGVVVLDNLCNSPQGASLKQSAWKITGKAPVFYQGEMSLTSRFRGCVCKA